MDLVQLSLSIWLSGNLPATTKYIRVNGTAKVLFISIFIGQYGDFHLQRACDFHHKLKSQISRIIYHL